METYLISLAVAMIGGLMLSRVTKKLRLPAVTAYLVAGVLIGPFILGSLNIPFLDSLSSDGDMSLILGLLLILMSEKTDKTLLFALVYILI